MIRILPLGKRHGGRPITREAEELRQPFTVFEIEGFVTTN